MKLSATPQALRDDDPALHRIGVAMSVVHVGPPTELGLAGFPTFRTLLKLILRGPLYLIGSPRIDLLPDFPSKQRTPPRLGITGKRPEPTS